MSKDNIVICSNGLFEGGRRKCGVVPHQCKLFKKKGRIHKLLYLQHEEGKKGPDRTTTNNNDDIWNTLSYCHHFFLF